MATSLLRGLWICPLVLAGCGDSRGDASATDAGTGMVTVTVTATGTSGGPSSATESPTGTDSGTSTDVDPSAGTGFKFDIGSKDLGDTTGGPIGGACKVQGDIDAIGDCNIQAPPDSFSPALQWSFGPALNSMVTPLVGNFTDDNADGEIDLCDTPDVVFVGGLMSGYGAVCEIFVLDGATGAQHFAIPLTERVSCQATPAFGDIDNDGLPEIVAVYIDGVFRLKAFEHDGTMKWANTDRRRPGPAVLPRVRRDRHPRPRRRRRREIVFNHEVYDHDGQAVVGEDRTRWPGELEATTAVDLDGDGKLEVVTGHSAYHHDGTVYFENYPDDHVAVDPAGRQPRRRPEPGGVHHLRQGPVDARARRRDQVGPGHADRRARQGLPRVAAPRHDPRLRRRRQARVGQLVARLLRRVRGPRPADVVWQAVVQDFSGAAGGTAFDFLGDGVAEAMYADETELSHLRRHDGQVVLTQPRQLHHQRVPDVVDVDNDGSAEILVVSLLGDGTARPAGASRRRGPLDPGPPDLEPARVLRHEYDTPVVKPRCAVLY
jgi:hypothetical protein